ncbi:MAG: hypothetical protein HY882_05225 [Deltaproteobacteria bacterium]|nr:hypothetical protein [Deltaproteobacteria bacterium]
MAAEAAQSQAARVLILARGMGSLPLTTGCIDVLGYCPGTSLTPLSSPATALTQLKGKSSASPLRQSRPRKTSFRSGLFPRTRSLGWNSLYRIF